MKNNKGFILITVLIFISLISLFAFQALENALLEHKFYQTFQRQRFLFAQAQAGLREGEFQEKSRCNPQDKDLCITFTAKANIPNTYEIIARASQGELSVTLKSTCMKPTLKEHCLRQSWEQLM